MYYLRSLVNNVDPDKAILRDVTFATTDKLADGLAIREWDLDRYIANPVVLWAHDHQGDAFGHANPSFGAALAGDITFFADEDLSPDFRRRKRLYLNAQMRGVSAGFAISRRLDRAGSIRAELCEISLCAVPMDPKTLASGRIYADGTFTDIPDPNDTIQTLQAIISRLSGRVSDLETAIERARNDELVRSITRNLQMR